MFTCSKIYSDIPFAHRQHRHPGHCAFIHGHNWAFTFTFGCRQLDENGFVVDFGALKYIRRWFEENLDHACVFNRDDPDRETLTAAVPGAYKTYIVENCSAEGLAKHLFEVADTLVRTETLGRAFVLNVRVDEDSRNSATFAPDFIKPEGNVA
jgi:6-pyruvoyltetrahydropterin/6-carboxytetrahydropterin synthase